MTHTYAVVIEPAGAGFSAYVPDLPGCVAAASTREGLRAEIRGRLQAFLAVRWLTSRYTRDQAADLWAALVLPTNLPAVSSASPWNRA